MSDGELFFIIQNGIRFTTMPGWGTGDPAKDSRSWELVHLVRHLPSITGGEELQEMASLNPKTKKELQEESPDDQFPSGDDTAASGATTHTATNGPTKDAPRDIGD